MTHIAIRWLGKAGDTRDFTFENLRTLTNRFANVLDALNVERGDRVFVITDRIPELDISVLGALKHGSVACTLFSAFGPEPIRQRLAIGAGTVLVTTERLYRRKIAPIRASLPALEHVLIVGDDDAPTSVPGTLDYSALLAEADDEFDVAATDPEDIALLHFTSGTTGTPKGALHAHEAVLAHLVTGRYALDLHPDDVFWCTADPGWVTGTSYGIVSPLANGVSQHRRRVRVRRAALAVDPRGPAGERLVHRAHRGADDDEGRHSTRPGSTGSRACGSSPAWASRSTPRPCVGARRRWVSPSTTTGGRRRPGGS